MERPPALPGPDSYDPGSMSTPPAATPPKPEKKKYPVNLPQTAFPMKANLVQNEPATVKRWQSTRVYERLREARAQSPTWLFHDGPPYANGGIHLGHLMNKCLKDFVVRMKSMQGLNVPYVPGWDCHGLPIEHKVVVELVEGGKYEKLRGLDHWTRANAIRRECQKHAEKYVKLQAGQMQRLLTLGDYDHPYMTMSREYEGATLEVLSALLARGVVFRALKPVHWSIANETALADAELEYQDREDLSVYVDFEAADKDAVYAAFGLPAEAPDDPDEDDAPEFPDADDESASRNAAPQPGTRPHVTPSFMIWTTTPWTLPANLAIAVNPKFEYALVWIDGNVTVLAKDAVERVAKAAKSEEVVVLATTPGERLVGLRYRHPFMPTGGRVTHTILPADYVTLEDGTGLVHTAPGHGQEDFQTGQKHGLPAYCPVKGDGTYDASVPEWLRGLDIWKANDLIARRLRESGHMFFEHKFTHSYPHDWRSKTPVIFRCTEQWFVGVNTPCSVEGDPPRSIRERALAATEGGGVGFVPEWGRNRMRGMLDSRPDWCISRQRAWGLPIPAFELPDGTVFMTAASVKAVAKVVREKGSDAWFTLTPAQLLAEYDAKADPDAPAAVKGDPSVLARARKGQDILDVWFESGSSWNAVLRERGMGYPAELYLEGSDQHRGWFQLSLLPALGVTGRPPFRTILTHGFMVDRDGKKLSKSRADAARYEVDSLCAEFGMDVMRWWVSSLAYENDVKVDVELFALAGESYRKVRNTLRYMLGTLADHASGPPAPGWAATLPGTSIEAWVLGAYDAMARRVIEAYNRYDFQTVHKSLFDFCNDTLSATYLAAVKDRLYCDAPDSPRRRRTQAAMFALTDGLCRLLAPIMGHTADEAWRSLHRVPADDPRSVHLETFHAGFGAMPDARWTAAHEALASARVALEQAKATQGVENPLDAGVILPDPRGELAAFDRADLTDLLGVSRVSIDPAAKAAMVQNLAHEPRCDRSWKRDGTVRQRSDGGWLSDRDAAALGIT
ncbi:MAG: isoleucine--tRNA ligase [Phycisphaerae bacterium]|nr:MAG: isoleucine--tRNA ligase [Phycisphaerae bacterium]